MGVQLGLFYRFRYRTGRAEGRARPEYTLHDLGNKYARRRDRRAETR